MAALQEAIVSAMRAARRGAPEIAMDDASRMARARALGFDEQPYYHGTMADVSEFERSHGGALGPGVYVARTPRTTEAYASKWGAPGGNVMPLMVRGKMAPLEEYTSLAEQIAAQRHRTPNDPIVKLEVVRELERRGYAGVAHEGMDYHNVFNPANIRSVFAAFDPANATSRNILAGTAVAGAGLAGGLSLREALAQRVQS